MTDNVEVRFGGNTSDLDHASNKAQQDIKDVGKTASGLKGTFSALAQSMKNMFSGTNYADVSTKIRTVRAEMKELVEGASKGNIQMGILGRTFAEAAEHAAPLAAAIAAVAVALAGLYTVKKVLEFGEAMGEAAEQIDKVSQKLGMSAEEVGKWHGVAAMIHMDAAQMDSGFTRLERAMYMAANGGKQQSAAFKELGIDIRNLKSPSDAILAIADKFQTMPDGPKKIALSMQLMGRAGAQAIPILNQGSEGLKEMMQAAEDTGAVMSTDLVNAGLAVDEQFDEMHLLGTGLKNMFFEALAPAIHAIVSGMVSLGKRMIESYKNGGLVKWIVEALAVSFKVLASIVVAVGGVFIAFAQVAVGALRAVWDVAAGLARVMADLMSGNFSQAWTDAKKGASDLGAHLKGALTGAWSTVKGVARTEMGIWSSKMPKPDHPLAADEGEGGMDLSGPGAGGKKKKGKDHAKEEAKKRLEAYLEELDREEAAAEEDYQKKIDIEQKKLDALAAFYGKDSKEYIAQLKSKEALEREWAKKKKEIDRERIQHQEELREIDLNDEHEAVNDKINMARQEADQRVQLGRMSATERARAEIGFLQQERAEAIRHEDAIFQIKVKSMRDQLALLPLMSDAYRQMNAKIETAERQHAATMAQIDRKFNSQVQKANNDVVNANIAKWKGIVAPITSAMGNALNGLLTRTMTFKQAFISVCDSILSSFLQMGVEMLTNWIATQLGLRAAHAATKTAETTIDATAAAAQQATAVATNMANIASLAPVAGAAAFASTAAIPIVGPVLAPEAAAAAMGAVYALMPLAAASKGYDIPAGVNPLTQLHEKEMVLPAYLAEPLRGMLRSAGPRSSPSLAGMAGAAASSTRGETALRGSRGDVNLHYGPRYGGDRNMSMDQMLERDGKRLIRFLKRAKRNGDLD